MSRSKENGGGDFDKRDDSHKYNFSSIQNRDEERGELRISNLCVT